MKKIFLTHSIFFLLVACSPAKKLTFKTDTFMSAGKVQEFEMSIPKGVKRSTSDLRQYLFKKIEYKNSSVLYISLDINFGHSPNRDNWMKCSRPQEKYKCEDGQQDNGLYWKEVFSNEVVVGYYNVNKANKDIFDIAIASLRMK
jgi:hypothetical protein